jgi:hypothetical protein
MILQRKRESFSTLIRIGTYQQQEASAPQQQGFEPIGEILKRIAIKEGGKG